MSIRPAHATGSALVGARGEPRAAAEEHGDDQILRDGQQPPLHEHEPAGQMPGVRDVERRRIVALLQRERRVSVGSVGGEGVERHSPAPAQHTDVEVEDRARIAAGEQDREERDHAQYAEREPQEREHDVVRDHQQPLDQPQPAAEARVEMPFDADRIGGERVGRHLITSSSAFVTRTIPPPRPRVIGGDRPGRCGFLRARPRESTRWPWLVTGVECSHVPPESPPSPPPPGRRPGARQEAGHRVPCLRQRPDLPDRLGDGR